MVEGSGSPCSPGALMRELAGHVKGRADPPGLRFTTLLHAEHPRDKLRFAAVCPRYRVSSIKSPLGYLQFDSVASLV